MRPLRESSDTGPYSCVLASRRTAGDLINADGAPPDVPVCGTHPRASEVRHAS